VIEHLYFHVPFCGTKCPYCAFYSHPGGGDKMAGYVEAVLNEFECRTRTSPAPQPQTIFFGGGTPSILPVNLWERLLTRLPRAQEFTIECNPATVDAVKAALWLAHGVNRLSIGVQSFDNTLLQTLGRLHDAAQAQATYELVRAAGFDNVNLDLMFALPGQTRATWETTLHRAIALAPDHISAYCLTLEEDTEFLRRYRQSPAGTEEESALYELTVETLAAAGYQQYEISNYARPGRECAHNLAYWQGQDYLGCGPSAVSTIGPRRWQNVADTAAYLANPTGSIVNEETLSADTKRSEQIAFGLRMRQGIPAQLLRNRWDTELARLTADGLLQQSNGRIRLTDRGRLFADEVAAEFV
jgi:oxygen-independent coproporphyrinogen-3 oxidase